MPRVRLTQNNVLALPCVGRRRTAYRDTATPGLVLRVTPAGIRTWSLEYHVRRDGARRGARVTLGRLRADGSGLDLRAAKRAAAAALTRLEHHHAGIASMGVTVAQLVTAHLRAAKVRPATIRGYRALAEREVIPALGEISAARLTRAQVRGWAQAIARRTGYGANRALSYLSTAYSWACDQELVETNPCWRIRRPGEERQSERVLSTTELQALIVALDEYGHSGQVECVRFLLLTGVRMLAARGAARDEIEGLEGPDPRWVVPARRAKGGRAHVVPLSPPAVEVVRRRLSLIGDRRQLWPAWNQETGEYEDVEREVYHWSSKFRGGLRGAVDAAAASLAQERGEQPSPLPRWTIHGLRHTIATHLREDLDVSTEVIALILGHRPPGSSITRVYQRAELLPERRAALEAWANWLDGLRHSVGGAPGRHPTKRDGAARNVPGP